MSDPNPISGMTQEEIDEYKDAFGMFDINGDGAFNFLFPVAATVDWDSANLFVAGIDSLPLLC